LFYISDLEKKKKKLGVTCRTGPSNQEFSLAGQSVAQRSFLPLSRLKPLKVHANCYEC